MKPPILSLAERDRRWARIRGLMRERGFEGLLVAGFRSREMYEKRVAPPVTMQWDYFHHELIAQLAEGDQRKMGRNYPGELLKNPR